MRLDEEQNWQLCFLQARVEAGDRAPEVLVHLLAAADRTEAVAQLADMLRVDEQAAQGVLDHFAAGLTIDDRRRAREALHQHRSQATEG